MHRLSVVGNTLFSVFAAELSALCTGAHCCVRAGRVQAAKVHRRGDGIQLGALPTRLQFLPQLKEMQLRFIGNSELPVAVNVNMNVFSVSLCEPCNKLATCSE